MFKFLKWWFSFPEDNLYEFFGGVFTFFRLLIALYISSFIGYTVFHLFTPWGYGYFPGMGVALIESFFVAFIIVCLFVAISFIAMVDYM